MLENVKMVLRFVRAVLERKAGNLDRDGGRKERHPDHGFGSEPHK